MTDIITKTTSHFACPDCGAPSSQLDHIDRNNGSFGPWYCDECGIGVWGKFNAGNLVLERHTQRKVNTLVLLRHHKDDVSLFIVVDGMLFQTEAEPLDLGDSEGSSEFFYNQSTCPTNYLGVHAVIEGDDHDPHGVFQFVAQILRPDDFDAWNADWNVLFPQLPQP